MAGVRDAVPALDAALRDRGPFRAWLRGRTWCGETIGVRTEVAVRDRATLAETEDEALLFFLVIAREAQASVPVHLAFSVGTTPVDGAFELAVGNDRLHVTEAESRAACAAFLADGFLRGATVPTETGDALHFRGEPWGTVRGVLPPPTSDSSNLHVRVRAAREVLYKSYKVLDTANREPEILAHLARRKFPHVPRLLGELALGRGEDRLVLGIATEYVDGEDAFAWLVDGWRRELSVDPVPGFEPASLAFASDLGTATAALHEALVDRHPGPFHPEPFSEADAGAARKAALTNLGDALRALAARAAGDDDFAADARAAIFEWREGIEAILRGIDASIGTSKTVTHGDLHLGQVLRADAGPCFLDFEGEPERSAGRRGARLPPLRDVGTMVRSFAYVAHYVGRKAGPDPPDRVRVWEREAVGRYVDAYLTASALHREVEREEARRIVRGWAMEKALYELRYELRRRPENVAIPLAGILSLATG